MSNTKLNVDVYKVISRAVDEGVAYGIRRFYKHRDDTAPSNIEEFIAGAVMDSLSEWIKWDE